MTLINWCRHASSLAFEVFASSLRRTELSRGWERYFFQRLLQAIKDHQAPGNRREPLEAESESKLDCCDSRHLNQASEEGEYPAEDELCRPACESIERTAHPPAVLIADDEEAICFSLSRELRRHGIDTYVAADGPTALKLFRSHRGAIDVVFLDVRMPHLDGLATLAAMRRIDPAVRCCFMTAFSAAGLQDETSSPAVEVLKKPFDLDAFLGVATHLLAASTCRTGGRGSQGTP
ncbi:MAG TPA: response regulator [Gemmataceae bacterium]|nr:response regulator [Gemmataceae bacterium]